MGERYKRRYWSDQDETVHYYSDTEKIVADIDKLTRSLNNVGGTRKPKTPFSQHAQRGTGLEKKQARVAELRLRGEKFPSLEDTIRVGQEVLALSEVECDVELMMEELAK